MFWLVGKHVARDSQNNPSIPPRSNGSVFANSVLAGTFMGFPGGASGKEPACQCRRYEMWVWSLCQEDPLEKDTATHSSTHGP